MNDLKKIAADVNTWAQNEPNGNTATRLLALRDQLDALAAQAGEPSSVEKVFCPVCYSGDVVCDFLDGESSCGDCSAVWNQRCRVASAILSEMQNELDFLRADKERLEKQLHLANIDAWTAEAELAAPPPAAPTDSEHLSMSMFGSREEYEAALAPTAPVSIAELEAGQAWRTVADHGQPADGLYVAIYKNGENLPVGLCSYGDWEFYDADGDDERADDEGMVRGRGWSETAEDRGGDGYVHLRDVVAYAPADYQYRAEDMKSLRQHLRSDKGTR